MPLYDYACLKCGHIERDFYSHKCDPDAVAPKHCGKKMGVYLGSGRQACSAFEAYETNHIHPEGKTLKVRNSGDLRRFESEFGVRRIDADMESRGGKLYRRTESKGRVYI